jgi:hypothetical protein
MHTTQLTKSLLVGGITSTFIKICEKFIDFVVIIDLAQVIYLLGLTKFYLGFNWHAFGYEWGSVHLMLLGS